jgi:hypothetical protein
VTRRCASSRAIDRALAAAIRTLVTDQAARRERVELGLLRAAEFSWERTARETAAVYAAVRATLVDREPADPRGRAAVSEG